MMLALAAVLGFMAGLGLGLLRSHSQAFDLLVSIGRSFGIKTSVDWPPAKQQAYIIRVLTKLACRVRPACERAQQEVRDEWEALPW